MYTSVFLNIIPQTLHSCHNRLQRCLLSPLVVRYDESAAKHNQRANLSVEESTKEQRRRNDGNSDLCVRACVCAGALICIVRTRPNRREPRAKQLRERRPQASVKREERSCVSVVSDYSSIIAAATGATVPIRANARRPGPLLFSLRPLQKTK